MESRFHSERLRAVSRELFKRSARPSPPKLIAAVLVLSLAPLIWSSFAIQSFASPGPLGAKVIRLQSILPPPDARQDIGSANFGICGRDFKLARVDAVYTKHFSLFNPFVLLGAKTVNALEPRLSYAADTFYRALPIRPDLAIDKCPTRYVRTPEKPNRDLDSDTP